MKTSILPLALGATLLAATASAACSQDRLTTDVTLVSASSACGFGLAAGDHLPAVQIVLADPANAPRGATPRPFRHTVTSRAATPASPAVMKVSGEIHDFGVQGCTVSFAGGMPLRLAEATRDRGAAMPPLARGCRGVCGL